MVAVHDTTNVTIIRIALSTQHRRKIASFVRSLVMSTSRSMPT
jgi:hypothetical protein